MELSQLLCLPVFNKYLVSKNLIEPLPTEINIHIKKFGKFQIYSYSGKKNDKLYFERKQLPTSKNSLISNFNEILIWSLMDCNIKGV